MPKLLFIKGGFYALCPTTHFIRMGSRHPLACLPEKSPATKNVNPAVPFAELVVICEIDLPARARI